MKNVRLLDCTLRDGGFINNWEFGHDDIINIFERSVSAKIDIIEIGFLDGREGFDINRSMQPDSASMGKVFEGLYTGDAMIVGMIDFGTCELSNICDKKDSFIDGIRIIFKKKNRFEALSYISEIKKKGYKVFVQPVSITGYSDEEMIDLVERANEIDPYAMSIVDTYGLLHQGNLLHYFDIMDKHLKPGISMGYHAHNNFQLGYSNSMALIERDTDRDLVVDGSVFGIGKGAGNCPIELLAMYANERLGKHYEINQILESIDVNIMKIYQKAPWGYSLTYYLAASNDCHPKYVMHLMKMRTLSVKSINEILSSIAPAEKLTYNKEYMEQLYQDYQKKDINDASDLTRLAGELGGKSILVLGPGKSVSEQKADIQAYMAKNKPTVITINYQPADFYTDYIFVSNSKRYVGLSNRLQHPAADDIKIIATSNVTKTSGSFDYTFDYSSLVDMNFEIIDSSLLMLMRLLVRLGVKHAALAGFDGYSSAKGENYFNMAMEYEFVKDYAEKLNDYTTKTLETMKNDIDVTFVTKSKYE